MGVTELLYPTPAPPISTSTLGSLRLRLEGTGELLIDNGPPPRSPKGQPDGVLRGTHNFNVGATQSRSGVWTRTQPRRAGRDPYRARRSRGTG